MIKYLVLIMLLPALLFTSCNADDENKRKCAGDQSVYGRWMYKGLLVKDNADGDIWNPVENGHLLDINEVGTFFSSEYNDCDEGTVVVAGNMITLEYACPDFEPPSGMGEGEFGYDVEGCELTIFDGIDAFSSHYIFVRIE